MQEGVAAEASSLAGHLQLNNLVVIYDDNDIQIDGSTNLAFTEDVGKRYEAYGWDVLYVADGNTDLPAVEAAILKAKASKDKPTLICVKTNMGFDPEQTFVALKEVYDRYKETFVARGAAAEAQWNETREAWAKDNVEQNKLLQRMLEGKMPDNWEAVLPKYDENSKPAASRNINGEVLNAIAQVMPELIGGAADLTPSTKTALKCSHDFQADSRNGRYLRFGVREFGMFAIGNGISAYGVNMIPFTATFLTFLTYGYGAVRVGALSHLRHIYVMTHDSVLLGEDGPTHQPVEVLACTRSLPNILTFRPCDGNEIAETWKVMLNREGPSVIALSRQTINTKLVSKYTKNGAAKGVHNGCYVMNEADDDEKAKPDVIVISSGSEVELALEAAETLAKEMKVRVVSATCLELFDAQDLKYRQSVLIPGTLVISLEASSPYGWNKYAHKSVGVPAWGKSAPLKSIREDYGFNAKAFTQTVKDAVAQSKDKEMPLLPTLWPF